MADETTSPASEETTVPQPETTPETDTTTEEQEVTLPSDVDTFELPEKFKGKSAEEIAKAYVELEKMRNGQDTKDEDTTETTEKTGEETEGPNYFKEYIETGDLSEESIKELEKQGYTKEEVIDRLEFEKYKQEKVIADLVEPIGGIEEYTKLNEWAKDNIPQEQLDEFTKELQAAGPIAQKAMIKDMYSSYKHATGETYDGTIHTNEPQSPPGKGYTSQHELQKDMSDPRYGIDRSYTQAVEEKVAKSDLDKL